MSSGVKAAGLNASFDASGTAGSSVTSKGVAVVFTGGEIKTGRCEFGFVGRILGDKGFRGSVEGVVPEEVAGPGVLRVETEDEE